MPDTDYELEDRSEIHDPEPVMYRSGVQEPGEALKDDPTFAALGRKTAPAGRRCRWEMRLHKVWEQV